MQFEVRPQRYVVVVRSLHWLTVVLVLIPFAVIPLPPLSLTGSKLGHAPADIHQTVAVVLLVVIGLQVFGALYHMLVLRDRTVQRMV